MLTTFQRAIIATCCFVLLFVLVCPYTPSPTPVGKVKMVYFTFAILMLVSAFLIFFRELRSLVAEERRPVLQLIDITCARLC
jgi:hypothetical protein